MLIERRFECGIIVEVGFSRLIWLFLFRDCFLSDRWIWIVTFHWEKFRFEWFVDLYWIVVGEVTLSMSDKRLSTFLSSMFLHSFSLKYRPIALVALLNTLFTDACFGWYFKNWWVTAKGLIFNFNMTWVEFLWLWCTIWDFWLEGNR